MSGSKHVSFFVMIICWMSSHLMVTSSTCQDFFDSAFVFRNKQASTKTWWVVLTMSALYDSALRLTLLSSLCQLHALL